MQLYYLVDGEICESTTSTENDGAGHHGSLEGWTQFKTETD